MKVSKPKNNLCGICKMKINGDKSSYFAEFIKHKQYKYIKSGGLTVPSHQLLKLIIDLDRWFDSYFSKICHKNGLCNKMKCHLLNETKSSYFTTQFCNCNLLNKIVDFFTIVKIHFFERKHKLLIKSN